MEQQIQVPSQGWKQFLTARTEMLNAYDRAKEQSRAHKVETYQGEVAESEFRKWLRAFLPQKYGITSGYIISQGVNDSVRAPHFDVIIYEQLDSPILWIESNPDNSEQGKSRAIPAEFVKAVIEVKSNFTPQTAKDAANHLKELENIMNEDDANSAYKINLNKNFFCSIVFFELRKENEKKYKALDELINGAQLKNFFGAFILRGEDRNCNESCKITITGPVPIDIELPKDKTLLTSRFYKSKEKDFGCLVTWLDLLFSQFAFDLLALLNGTYRVGFVSSFYGFGSSNFDNEW